jgi:hypothetical protein
MSAECRVQSVEWDSGTWSAEWRLASGEGGSAWAEREVEARAG